MMDLKRRLRGQKKELNLVLGMEVTGTFQRGQDPVLSVGRAEGREAEPLRARGLAGHSLPPLLLGSFLGLWGHVAPEPGVHQVEQVHGGYA